MLVNRLVSLGSVRVVTDPEVADHCPLVSEL